MEAGVLQMEILSIVASVVSVIIGGFAIWLAVTFYKLSIKVSEDTREASKSISASVARLEGLFDRLYNDTFSMMKDTYSDMRRHMWPPKDDTAEIAAQIEATANAKIDSLREEITHELGRFIAKIGIADQKIKGVQEQVSRLIDRAIEQTRAVETEAQEEVSRHDLSNALVRLLSSHGPLKLNMILSYPPIYKRYQQHMIIDALQVMAQKGIIKADGPIGDLETIISIQDLFSVSAPATRIRGIPGPSRVKTET